MLSEVLVSSAWFARSFKTYCRCVKATILLRSFGDLSALQSPRTRSQRPANHSSAQKERFPSSGLYKPPDVPISLCQGQARNPRLTVAEMCSLRYIDHSNLDFSSIFHIYIQPHTTHAHALTFLPLSQIQMGLHYCPPSSCYHHA